MNFRVMLAATFLINAIPCLGQEIPKTPRQDREVVVQELDEILRTADKLDDKLAFVIVRSRAALLVSFSEPDRADKMFMSIWKFANDQTDENFPKQVAQVAVLKYLFMRNPKLARQLLTQMPTKPSSIRARMMGDDNEQQLQSKVASQLVETDPSTAAALLERSLSVGVTPGTLGALARLRQVNPLLADFIAAKTLDGLAMQPTLVSLPALPLFAAYLFPPPAATIPSVEAESSLQNLQFRYFVVSDDVLRNSLPETNETLIKDQHYTQPDLQFRAANQALVAGILAALAPRFRPLIATEMAQLAARLRTQVPPHIAQMSQLALTRLSGNELASDKPEERFAFALSNGELDEARKQLDRLPDGKQKDVYTQLLIRNDARAHLADSDVMGAVIIIRKLEDETSRLVMYLDALKVTRKKNDPELTKLVVNEARLLIPQTERNGIHIRALLLFAAQLAKTDNRADAAEFLASAVTSINGLTRRNKEEAEPQTMAEEAMAELNDPASLLDATEMEQAFSAIGLIDLEHALGEAKRIDRRSVQLVARLEAIQGIIKRNSMKSKTPPNPSRVSSTPK